MPKPHREASDSGELGVVDRRKTSVMLSLRHAAMLVGSLVVLTSVGTGIVLWLGGELVSPASAIAHEREERKRADSVSLAERQYLAGVYQAQVRIQAAFRDTVLILLRPLQIKLCLTTKPYELSLLDVDCEELLQQARRRALGLPNTLEPNR